ncbi:hypothetical protein DSCO28_20720 [Desulfosarcina ovata subsp. sediminis]|uniref:Uncharacterized protein n=2 Tax=Desulfosarcina ovata TaxID=83564 RepID=A0A5K7ZKE0_9BACT|nr:hypothetical protein DSCO28_20720 [Desulfosarcina ovata subsp. sediminis]
MQQLIKHPKTFLHANAVWVSGQMNFKGKGKGEIWPVRLVRDGGVSCTKRGNGIPCWEIVSAISLDEIR